MRIWRDRITQPHRGRAADLCEQEQSTYTSLDADVEAGLAFRATDDPLLGPPLECIMRNLLRHPLCRKLSKPPEIYVHHDIHARLSTFGNVILVPYHLISGNQLDNPNYVRALKGGLAHELAHILNDDFRRLTENPALGMSTDMERRADLIGAHLCGDGGNAIAEWLVHCRKLLELTRDISHHPRESYVTEQANRYPSLDERISDIRKWSNAYARGISLPSEPGHAESFKYR